MQTGSPSEDQQQRRQSSRSDTLDLPTDKTGLAAAGPARPRPSHAAGPRPGSRSRSGGGITSFSPMWRWRSWRDWSAPELIALDPGSGSEPATGNDWMYTAVQMLLTGGAGIDMATI